MRYAVLRVEPRRRCAYVQPSADEHLRFIAMHGSDVATVDDPLASMHCFFCTKTTTASLCELNLVFVQRHDYLYAKDTSMARCTQVFPFCLSFLCFKRFGSVDNVARPLGDDSQLFSSAMSAILYGIAASATYASPCATWWFTLRSFVEAVATLVSRVRASMHPAAA